MARCLEAMVLRRRLHHHCGRNWKTNDTVPLKMPLKFMRNPSVWRPTVADALSVCGRSSHGEHPSLQQLQKQLECFDRLMESPGTRRETADAIMTRSKEAISSMRERASEEDLLDVRSLFNVNCDEVSEHHDPEEDPQNVLDDLEMVYERLELSGVIPMCHLVPADIIPMICGSASLKDTTRFSTHGRDDVDCGFDGPLADLECSGNLR